LGIGSAKGCGVAGVGEPSDILRPGREGEIMKKFLQILLTLGLLVFLVGIAEALVGKTFLFSPQGYWRGALALWILLIATRATYQDTK
jgi:hypothetical protein